MRFLPVIFLLGVAACVHSEQCPSQEDLKPCICSEIGNSGKIEVKCFSYYSDDKVTLDGLKKAFQSLQGKKNVKMLLFDNTLGRIPTDLFKGIGIKELDIEHCRIDSLADADEPIFAGLEDSLEVLRIQKSFRGDADLSKLRFSHLQKLRDLTFFDNKFNEVSNSWFENGPASLEIIDLLKARIERIGDRVFADLPNLTRISLFGNKIHSVNRGMFPKPALHLKELYFEGNPLEKLPADIFSDMPALTTLTVTMNVDTITLDEKTWRPIWEQLTYLDVSEMPLICDSSMNWLFELRMPRILNGYCAEGSFENLEDFIKNGQISS